MIPALESLRTLAGDALVAVGAALRSRREGFADYEAGDFLLDDGCSLGRMESDGPDAGDTWEPLPWPRPSKDDVRSAVDELSDSGLLEVAAKVIEGWTPILLETTRDLTDVDVLVAALRDRADQFRAVEKDAEQPFPTPVQLDDTLTRSSQHRGE